METVAGEGRENVVRCVHASTDRQEIARSPAPLKILLGPMSCGGRGCGGDPDRGRLAAMESLDGMMRSLDGTGLVVIAAGMGGGTGTGCAPVVARALREREHPPIVVAFVTTPFSWELNRHEISERALARLAGHCSGIVAFSNAATAAAVPEGSSVGQTMEAVNRLLRKASLGITALLTGRPGYPWNSGR
jgi:cell division protein FtsZ